MNVFQNFFSSVEKFFTRAKGSQAVKNIDNALAAVAQVIPHAIPIVEDIAAMTPNKTVQEVAGVLEKYIGPMAQQIDDNPTAIGNILLNTATAAVQKALPANLAPTALHLVQTAVQLVVTATNANPPAPAPVVKPAIPPKAPVAAPEAPATTDPKPAA